MKVISNDMLCGGIRYIAEMFKQKKGKKNQQQKKCVTMTNAYVILPTQPHTFQSSYGWP